MIGKVCKCKKGILGIPTRVRYRTVRLSPRRKREMYYEGINLDGGNWESKDPTVIAENVNEFIEKVMRG